MAKCWGIEWTEYERGWGCRPDGFSFHTCKEAGDEYVERTYDNYPKEVPDVYSRADEPKLYEVSQSIYDRVHSKGDLRLWVNNTNALKDYVYVEKA